MLASVEHLRSKYLQQSGRELASADATPRAPDEAVRLTRQAQWFLSAFSGITGHFQLRRHMLSASDWRREMTARFAVWNEITATATAA
ncbi:hypothetical protein MLGJGCBP_00245 [Rhodococcus sp. T7]|nr:hypothetical protein MLGJGCBP_10181 [Rhodococcus sp. T7]KAF0966570.1 hypothetical protein MLGJGCBP_00245 [Rhodococcus sp. T7]